MEFPKSVHCLFVFLFLPGYSMPTPPFFFNWCFSIQECSPNELEDVFLARWLIGEDASREWEWTVKETGRGGLWM